MVEGGMKCIKVLLFIFNLLFVIAGIGLIATGAYVNIKLDEYYDFFGKEYVGPGILLIIVGVVIFLIAFFGCCGAVKENYCLTMTFAVCLAIIFILEIAGGIAGFVLRDKIDDEVKDDLTEAMKNYGKEGHDGVTKTWDKLQEELECCGVDSYEDWKNIANITRIPESCCKDAKKCTGKEEDIYNKPCASQIEQWLKDKVAIIGGVGIGLAFVQVVGVMFACCLARAIKKEYEVV